MTTASQKSSWETKLLSALTLFVFACWSPHLASAHLQDRIVAIVNSELIMLSDVQREFGAEQERLSRTHRGTDLPQRLKTAEYMALTKLIERKLQLQ